MSDVSVKNPAPQPDQADDEPTRRPSRLASLPAPVQRAVGIARTQEAGLLGVIVVLVLIFGSINERFLSTINLYNIVQAVAVIGVMAVGQAFVLIAKEIDLSVGSVLGLSGVTAGWLIAAGLNPWLAVLLAIAVGAVVGATIGTFVVGGKVSSFIVTLGMLSVARGLTQLITGGLPLQVPEELRFLGQGRVFGSVPVSVLIFLGLALVGQLVLSRTVFGQRVTAVGDNDEAARLGGIPTGRSRMLVFVLCSSLAAVAGIIYMTQTGVAEAQAGRGLELDVIAAVVIGGASLSGGRGSIIGAFLGACLLGVLRNAFVLLQLSPFFQELSIGLVIVLAALFDQFRQGAFTLPPWLSRKRATA